MEELLVVRDARASGSPAHSGDMTSHLASKPAKAERSPVSRGKPVVKANQKRTADRGSLRRAVDGLPGQRTNSWKLDVFWIRKRSRARWRRRRRSPCSCRTSATVPKSDRRTRPRVSRSGCPGGCAQADRGGHSGGARQGSSRWTWHTPPDPWCFFTLAVDDLYALRCWPSDRPWGRDDLVVVSPDVGFRPSSWRTQVK